MLEFVEPNDEMPTAPVSHQKRPQQSATNAIKGNENTAKSMKAIDLLPLITIWLQVSLSVL